MKKILAALLALMMVVACVATLASCGKAVPADYEDAKEALEDADYQVMGTDEEDYLSTGMKAQISARDVTEDKDDREAFIYIYYFENEDMAKFQEKFYKMNLEQNIEEAKLTIEYYEMMLEKYADDLEDEEKEEIEEELEEMQEELEAYKNDYVVGRKGTTVWYGYKSMAEVAAAN